VELLVAPSDVENVAYPQGVQLASPFTDLYVPSVHCEQVPPLLPVNPGRHLQSLISSLASTETLSAPHERHVLTEDASYLSLHVPVGHGVQIPAPMTGLYFPG
jgi:hypothetical protein